MPESCTPVRRRLLLALAAATAAPKGSAQPANGPRRVGIVFSTDPQTSRPYLEALVSGIEQRGYRYATLEEVLRDPAYALPDDYVGAWGISWLHHWEVTAGQPRTPSPDPPAWIQQAYDALPRQ